MVPEQPLYPGVHIEETPGGERAITGVSTSITVFIGLAFVDRRDDPTVTFKPTPILSYSEYEATFGPPHPNSELATAVRLFFLNGGDRCYVVNVANDVEEIAADNIVNVYKNAIKSLDSVDIFNLMVVTRISIMSDIDYLEIIDEGSKYCRDRRAFLLIDPLDEWNLWYAPLDASKINISHLRESVVNEYTAIYFPRLLVREYDIVSDSYLLKKIGPAAAVAGVFARVDSKSGVWKAPVGTNATIFGSNGVDIYIADKQNRLLNDEAINCIRLFNVGTVCWGVRTIAGFVPGEWRYIPVRRLALFIEESVYRGTQWAMFEPNDEPTWAAVRTSVRSFMMDLFRKGVFQDGSLNEAFFVKCDGETTTEHYRSLGIMNIIVGFAPLKPAEFIVCEIQQYSELS